MASELQPLSLLFQNRLFRIPDYQRGYAWQQPQLVDFWDDLINLQQDRYHYTGLLSLKTLGRKDTKDWGSDLWMVDKGFKACHIVDGQQRLTTFVILLNEIISFVRELEENNGKRDEEIVLGYDTLKDVVSKYICQSRPPLHQIITYLFGYEVDNPSADYLRYKIFGEPYSGTVNETYYTKNLKFAKKFFSENLAVLYKSEGMDGINSLYSKLTLKLMFNIHEIDDDYDVFVAFETMNNRGKKLTNLELLKNRLIYLTTLYADHKFDETEKSHLRKQINDAWKEVYFQLGRNKRTPLSDDEFLRAHWTIYFTYSRRKGDDYIRFLLNKFSAKNIFEKKTVLMSELTSEYEADDGYEDGEYTSDDEHETIEISKLAPAEIADYVNSLKNMAKYWYDTFFPAQSDNLTRQEQVWVDKLNRIGIGYFRPLVAVIISRRDIPAEARITAFRAIERFIFICFRLGNFNASFCSSDYYRASRSLYFKEMPLDDLVADIVETTDANIEYAIPGFVAKIEKHFSDGGGFYYWNSIRYFMYEYETSLALKNNIDRIGSWEMFTKAEKDRVSIEHILPQKPTKYDWRNTYRQFTDEEKEMLAGALGNLLPLSQSINSSMQNDSFQDKKTSAKRGRRGYENGCHSEIEVAKCSDWTAKDIYDRSKKLLEYMEKRWEFSLSREQLEKLVYVSFAVDGREVPAKIPAPADGPQEAAIETDVPESREYSSLDMQQKTFWVNFVNHCIGKGREDIAGRKPLVQNWYDVPVGADDFHLSFTVTRSKYISLLIYAYDPEAFKRLESQKAAIEAVFGDKLDWYSSREKSTAKRIVYKHEADIFNPSKQAVLFDWMIEKFDALVDALVTAGEISNGELPSEKFAGIRTYLTDCGKSTVSLSFAEIENIIGTQLCKSAYNYTVYWRPSATHSMGNAILAAGYDVVSVDLLAERINLKKHN